MGKYRALIVDDEPQVRHATARALSPIGFDCELASDGRDALEFIQHTKYDLVVTDLKMPDVNGHKLATKLLSLEPRPIISVLTGVEEPKLARDLTTRGVERIYYKPVDYKEFASDLAALVEKREAAYGKIENGSLEFSQMAGTESLPEQSASQLSVEQQVSEPLVDTVQRDQLKVVVGNAENQCPARSSGPNNCDAANTNGMMANNEPREQSNSGTFISNAFSIKIDAELLRTKKALIELQRTVAAGQNQSYFCLALALGAGLIGGLILGWLSSQLLSPTTVFK
jgi:DNA-binding response OmpR family regulator